MNKLGAIPLLIAATLAVTAISLANLEATTNSLVGKWKMTNNPKALTIYDFKKNGTFTNMVTASLHGHQLKVFSTGEYTLRGNSTSQRITSIVESSDDPATNAQLKPINIKMVQILKSMKTMYGTIEWKGADKAILEMRQPAMLGQPAKIMQVVLKKI